jgi:hypothetical protein
MDDSEIPTFIDVLIQIVNKAPRVCADAKAHGHQPKHDVVDPSSTEPFVQLHLLVVGQPGPVVADGGGELLGRPRDDVRGVSLGHGFVVVLDDAPADLKALAVVMAPLHVVGSAIAGGRGQGLLLVVVALNGARSVGIGGEADIDGAERRVLLLKAAQDEVDGNIIVHAVVEAAALRGGRAVNLLPLKALRVEIVEKQVIILIRGPALGP